MARIILAVLVGVLAFGCAGRNGAVAVPPLEVVLSDGTLVELVPVVEEEPRTEFLPYRPRRPRGFNSFGARGDMENRKIEMDSYGLGVHSDQFGRPVKIVPAQGHSFQTDPLTRIEGENAFGPGIHMDQYGRPVQVVPAW